MEELEQLKQATRDLIGPEKKWSNQRAAAQALGVTQATVSRFLKSKDQGGSDGTWELYRSLAEHLPLQVAALVGLSLDAVKANIPTPPLLREALEFGSAKLGPETKACATAIRAFDRPGMDFGRWAMLLSAYEKAHNEVFRTLEAAEPIPVQSSGFRTRADAQGDPDKLSEAKG